MLDSSKTLNGSFGKLYSSDGTWLTNVNRVELNGEVSKEEIKRSGTRVRGHKSIGLTWSGSCSGYKISTAFARELLQFKNSNSPTFVTELVFKLDDPDASEKIWIRVKGVQFDSIPIITSEAEVVVTEEMPFTCSDIEFL